MIVVGRAIVDGDADRMFILLSYSSALRLTVLTKRSCAYTPGQEQANFDWSGHFVL